MYIAALSSPGPVYLTCWVLKFIRCSSKISSVVLSDFPRFCRIWGIASYMMVDKCDTKFRQFDLSLSIIGDHVLPWHTSCQHIAGIFPASSSRKPKLGPISTFCPVWKSLPAGCRTPSELTRLTAGRLLEARDRRNCFGIDARGCWLFPGQGQLVPTRARHTPAFAHFYSLRTNTRWLSMKTHTLLSNKTLPLAKIHVCTQETFVVLLYSLKKPAVCMYHW